MSHEEDCQSDEAELHRYYYVAEANGHPPYNPVRICGTCQYPRHYGPSPDGSATFKFPAHLSKASEHIKREPQEKHSAKAPSNAQKDLVLHRIGESHYHEGNQYHLEDSMTAYDKRTGNKSPLCSLGDGNGQDRSGNDGSGKGDGK